MTTGEHANAGVTEGDESYNRASGKCRTQIISRDQTALQACPQANATMRSPPLRIPPWRAQIAVEILARKSVRAELAWPLPQRKWNRQ